MPPEISGGNICCLQINCGIHTINITLIQLFTEQLDCLAKALEVNNFPLTQEFDYIIHIRIIGKPENIIISGSGLLLCCYRISTT